MAKAEKTETEETLEAVKDALDGPTGVSAAEAAANLDLPPLTPYPEPIPVDFQALMDAHTAGVADRVAKALEPLANTSRSGDITGAHLALLIKLAILAALEAAPIPNSVMDPSITYD